MKTQQPRNYEYHLFAKINWNISRKIVPKASHLGLHIPVAQGTMDKNTDTLCADVAKIAQNYLPLEAQLGEKGVRDDDFQYYPIVSSQLADFRENITQHFLTVSKDIYKPRIVLSPNDSSHLQGAQIRVNELYLAVKERGIWQPRIHRIDIPHYA